MQITIVAEKYAEEAKRLDMLGLPIPEYMVVKTVVCAAEAVLLPSLSMNEVEELLARFV